MIVGQKITFDEGSGSLKQNDDTVDFNTFEIRIKIIGNTIYYKLYGNQSEIIKNIIDIILVQKRSKL